MIGFFNLKKSLLQLQSASPKSGNLLRIIPPLFFTLNRSLQDDPLISDRMIFSPQDLKAPAESLFLLGCGDTDGGIAIDGANLGNLLLVFLDILPISYKDLHGGQERLLALKENTAAMLPQRIIAETEGEGGGHEL